MDITQTLVGKKFHQFTHHACLVQEGGKCVQQLLWPFFLWLCQHLATLPLLSSDSCGPLIFDIFNILLLFFNLYMATSVYRLLFI